MLNKLILGVILNILFFFSSCKKEKLPEAWVPPENNTVTFKASSASDFDVTLKVYNQDGSIVFLESKTGVKSYEGEYLKVKAGQMVEASTKIKSYSSAIVTNLKFNGEQLPAYFFATGQGGYDLQRWVILAK